jgi:hypothetical protein
MAGEMIECQIREEGARGGGKRGFDSRDCPLHDDIGSVENGAASS